MSSYENKVEKGSLLWRFSKKFQFAAENIIPDPLVFCLILTLILFFSGIIFTKTTISEMLKYWYDGIWSQIGFAFQMSFMVVTCSVTAKSKFIKKLLKSSANLVKSRSMAIIVLMIFGYVSSFLNWAFGTIVTPIFGMYLTKKIKGLHFPMLVAAGYSTMILGQCLGPSASVYALLASKNHFLVDKIGVLTQGVTTYNPMNVILWTILAVGTIILTISVKPPIDEIIEFDGEIDEEFEDESKISNNTLAEKMNNNSIIMILTGLGGLISIVYEFIQKGILESLNINFVIFIFLTANFFLYASPKKFIKAYRDNLSLATDVIYNFHFMVEFQE